MEQLFDGKDSVEYQQFLKLEIASTIAQQPDLYIACPTPDCQEYIEARNQGFHEKMMCPTCNASFCSKCKLPFHGIPNNIFKYSSQGGAEGGGFDFDFLGSSVGGIEGSFEVDEGEFVGETGLTCEQAAETVRRWMEWRQRGRADYMGKVCVEGCFLYFLSERMEVYCGLGFSLVRVSIDFPGAEGVPGESERPPAGVGRA